MPGRKIVGVVYNPRNDRGIEIARRISEADDVASGSWICPVTEIQEMSVSLATTDLIVTVGGDGTILRTAQVAAPWGVPMLGVNLGRVGFMTELSAKEALDRLAEYLEATPESTEERAMLQGEVIRARTPSLSDPPFPFLALNDIVVARGTATRLIHVEAALDGQPITTYYADGVIVATATGSTAYSFSLGGPILYPKSQDLLLMAIAPHLSFKSGLVLDGSSEIELSLRTDWPAVLSGDGFINLELMTGDRVRIRRSSYTARFLRLHPGVEFYRTLAERLDHS